MNSNNKIDEIFEKQKKEEEKQKKIFEDLKIACKGIASGTNGKFFLKFLKDICFWDEEDCNINNEILIYKKGRRDIWIIIRKILPPDVLAQIEIYDDKEK